MECDSDEEVVKSWAENVRRLRSREIRIRREGDPERAKSSAVGHAKSCDLLIRWNLLERILERTAQSFVTVFGIGAGFLAYAGTGSHAVSVAAHLGAEGVVRPYAEETARAINDAVAGSNLYLRRLAETGAQHVFAITDEDFTTVLRRHGQ